MDFRASVKRFSVLILASIWIVPYAYATPDAQTEVQADPASFSALGLGGGGGFHGPGPGPGRPIWGGGGGYHGHPGYPGVPVYNGHPYPGHGNYDGGRDREPWFGHGGGYPWPYWGHPVFARPIYDWDWAYVRVVTCTAMDSYGGLYSVTDDGYFGWNYRDRMNEIEDAALNRCFSESRGDRGCHLFDCRAGY